MLRSEDFMLIYVREKLCFVIPKDMEEIAIKECFVKVFLESSVP